MSHLGQVMLLSSAVQKVSVACITIVSKTDDYHGIINLTYGAFFLLRPIP